MATFRAIENGVSLVRPSLSGLSTAVDPQGRTLAQIDAFTTGAPTLVTMVATQGRSTLYATIGDSFAYLCVVGLLWLIALATFYHRANKPALPSEEPVVA
jgi:apolipoprotein N-acyltransferase